MNIRHCHFVLFIFILLAGIAPYTAEAGPYQDFYNAIQSSDSAVISAQIKSLENSSIKEKEAYSGALMMKMSGIVKSGLEKLKIFKAGRIKLENSIRQDSLNAEYRFLRLIIQEHVPDFMNYHSKRVEDAKMISESFGKLNATLQKAIEIGRAHV